MQCFTSEKLLSIALDPLASVVICLMIVYASYEIFKDAIDKMVDRSCDEATINTMTALINAQKGVDHIDVLQTRKFGCRIYVDVEVSADDDLTLLEAHTIAENIHKAIESNFGSCFFSVPEHTFFNDNGNYCGDQSKAARYFQIFG